MFGINPGEFAVLLLVALIVVGPERLPKYAQHLGRLVREGRRMAMGLREQVRGELGPEFDDVDWTKLDPRQYDPRKIIRDALSENLDDEPKPVSDGAPKAVDTAAEDTTKDAAKDGAVDLQKREAADRPGSAASPMAAAAKGKGAAVAATAAGATAAGAATVGAGLAPDDAAAAKAAATKPAPSEPEDFLAARAAPTTFGTDDEQAVEVPSVPAARTAGGAPVDLEAT